VNAIVTNGLPGSYLVICLRRIREMNKTKTPKPALNDNESLFREAMGDVAPLSQDKVVHRRSGKTTRQQQTPPKQLVDHYFSDSFVPALPTEGPMRYVRSGVSSFELKKLRRGDYPPEAILDLHGYTVAQTRLELIALIEACKTHHYPCASVMHGLGSGKLKQQVPIWLAQHPDIKAFHQAPLEWGGNGALLLLIDVGLEDLS